MFVYALNTIACRIVKLQLTNIFICILFYIMKILSFNKLRYKSKYVNVQNPNMTNKGRCFVPDFFKDLCNVDL